MDQALRHLIVLIRADESCLANGDDKGSAALRHVLELALKDLEKAVGVPLSTTLID